MFILRSKLMRRRSVRRWPHIISRCIAIPSAPSFVEGPQEPPLLYQTIPEHFAGIVSKHGDRPAVMCRAPVPLDTYKNPNSPHPVRKPHTSVLTYEALDILSNRLANSLRSIGVKKGDRVAVSLGSVEANAALTYAIFKLGAILVPLNPTFNTQQLTTALRHLEVETLIIGAVTDLAYKPCQGRSNLNLLKSFLPNLTSPKLQSPDVPSLKTVVLVENTPSTSDPDFPAEFEALTSFSALLRGSAEKITPDSALLPDDTINIQFTSGTTSAPKAAKLTHVNILNNGRFVAARMGLEPSDHIVVPPPLFHCFGSVLGYMATATTGAALLLPSPAFDPAASLKMVAEQRATGLYGVSTMFVAELELLRSNPTFANTLPLDSFVNLQKGIASGSSVPESLMHQLFKILGLRDLVICYGMTETGPVSLMTTPSDPMARRTSSVGRVMPHTALKIVDRADQARVIPRGERGELAVAGYLVMQGYWGDEEQTAAVRRTEFDKPDEIGSQSQIRERVWMYTGDEACMDENGYVEITGRIKDLIIRGGENINPLEVEDCIFQCPGVQEVSVIAVPDQEGRYGEEVGAFVVPKAGWRPYDEAQNDRDARGNVIYLDISAETVENHLRREDIQKWVREKLSGHLVPRYVWWLDVFPKTASGKIQKYKLREMAPNHVKSHRDL